MTISDDVRAADSIAKIANEMAHYDWVMPPPIEIWAQRLQALADGRTVCVRVMSEDECRAKFEAWSELKIPGRLNVFGQDGHVNRFNASDPTLRYTGERYYFERVEDCWQAWLACARAMGAIKG